MTRPTRSGPRADPLLLDHNGPSPISDALHFSSLPKITSAELLKAPEQLMVCSSLQPCHRDCIGAAPVYRTLSDRYATSIESYCTW